MSALLFVGAQAHGQCTTVIGTKLTIKSATDDTKDKLVWKTKDASVDLLIDDPSTSTTTVELFDADGRVLLADLGPGSGPSWSPRGTPISRWVYKGRTDPNNDDGIERIISDSDKFKFTGRGVNLDEIRAPLPLPIVMRLTTGSRCFDAVFDGCKKNTGEKIVCKASCEPTSIQAEPGADRVIAIDALNSVPWQDRVRAFNMGVTSLEQSAGGRTRGVELIDRMFDDRPGRQVRMKYGPSSWPSLGFDAACDWLGQEPAIDPIAAYWVSTGAQVEMRLMGQPAAFSSSCDPVGCAGRMKPGGSSCVCQATANDFGRFIPHAYSQAWKDHWKCVLRHYANLGVRRFEVWNEPDQPDFFLGNWAQLQSNPTQWQQDLEMDFIEMFEQMRLALEEARDELDPAVAAEIEIGGPAMSTIEGTIGNAVSPSLPTVLSDVTLGPGDGDLDFVSAHFYTSDPGLPFVSGAVGDLRSFVPPAWGPVRLELNEWNIGLGANHPCQDADANPANGLQAPDAGQDASAGCDHRGAGYAAYMLAGMVSAGDDVQGVVFEALANGNAERCDMIESSLGLFTKHGLPKPYAAVHWAVSQMDWRLLGAAQETLGDKSLGWIAAQDQGGVVHVLIGQFDSTQRDHFSRQYASRGNDPIALFSDCGCASAAVPSACIEQKITASGGTVSGLLAQCPGLTAAAAADVLTSAAAALNRVEGSTATVALDIGGLGCRGSFHVEVFTTGPGQSTADLWRSLPGPHQGETQCTSLLAQAIDDHPYDWLGLQDQLWDLIRTPTQTFTLRSGDRFPVLEVPAYGSVYVQIR